MSLNVSLPQPLNPQVNEIELYNIPLVGLQRGQRLQGQVDLIQSLGLQSFRAIPYDGEIIHIESVDPRTAQAVFKSGVAVNSGRNSQFCDISPDPFGVRAKLAGKPIIETLPDPENAEEMSQYLADCDLVEGVAKPYIKDNEIPGIFHYVWVGSELTKPQFRRNVENWRKQYPEYEVIIWTDQESLSEEMKQWCEENDVRMINIYKSLPDDAWHGLKESCLLQMSKTQPNYGEVSDILRYILLYNFGGRYLDTDSYINYLDHSSKHNTTLPGGFGMLLNDGIVRGNDCFIAKQKHPFFKLVIDSCVRNYNLSYAELESVSIPSLNQNRHVKETVIRSGPCCIGKCFIEHIKETGLSKSIFSLDQHERFHGVAFAGSWHSKNIKPMDHEFTSEDRERIIAEILWDIKNDPEILNLRKYELWIGIMETL